MLGCEEGAIKREGKIRKLGETEEKVRSQDPLPATY